MQFHKWLKFLIVSRKRLREVPSTIRSSDS